MSTRRPDAAQLIHFGANVPALVLHGQWYRLLTATFVHVGLIHLLTNMWCLWNLGLLGEPLLGPWGMVAVYMLTGIAGNLLSLGVNIVMRDFISGRCWSLRGGLWYCRHPDRPALEPQAADSCL